MNMLKKKTFILSCLILAGCANANSIHRKWNISEAGQTEFVDAKQRAVIVNKTQIFQGKGSEPNRREPVYRICSEPSPDVFSIYALSLTGSLSGNPFAGSNLSDKEQAELMLAMASSENGSTIERTQTINLMRESMFRTCERYLNGAIDHDTMQIQAARDQRAMVAVLAIEQLTGVVKRKPTVLSTETQATLTSANKELVDAYLKDKKDYEESVDEASEAKKKHELAETSYKSLNKIVPPAVEGKCDLLEKSPPEEQAVSDESQGDEASDQSQPNTVSTNKVVTESVDPHTGDKKVEETITTTSIPVSDTELAGKEEASEESEPTLEQCQSFKAAVGTAQSELDIANATSTAAKERMDTSAELLKTVSSNYFNAASSGTGSGDRGTSYNSSHINNVADTVKEITLAAFDNDAELFFTCTNILRKNQSSNPGILDICEQLFTTKVKSEITKLENESAVEIARARQAWIENPVQTSEAYFDRFWPFVSKIDDPNKVDSSRLFSLVQSKDSSVQKIINNRLNKSFLDATTKSELRTRFMKLPERVQSKLSDQVFP